MILRLLLMLLVLSGCQPEPAAPTTTPDMVMAQYDPLAQTMALRADEIELTVQNNTTLRFSCGTDGTTRLIGPHGERMEFSCP